MENHERITLVDNRLNVLMMANKPETAVHRVTHSAVWHHMSCVYRFKPNRPSLKLLLHVHNGVDLSGLSGVDCHILNKLLSSE